MEWKSSEKWGRPGNTKSYHMTWTRGGHGRAKYKFVSNKPGSEFLAGEVKHSHYCRCLHEVLPSVGALNDEV